MTRPILGGVLVGGRSRRMGRLKQLVEIGDGTMIEQVVRALSEEVDEVVLLGGGPVPATLEGLSRMADGDHCQGPMAGILGALRAEPEACWVAAPCDLPLLQEYSLHRLASSSRVATPEPPAALRRCWFNANTPQDLGALRAG
ncbi:MAG: NTP transferase domain-containing protein [Acidobacteria bacterium]|nr:NTP transferase domain-containing protein [Candidatus Sulfomarinibacter kjeldsenii]